MSSKYEEDCLFQLLEWPTEPMREWGPIYSPHTFITVGGVRTSDISDLDQICLMGNSNCSTLTGSDISDGARIYPIKGGDMVLKPDKARINS
jgi:hypothetical protein